MKSRACFRGPSSACLSNASAGLAPSQMRISELKNSGSWIGSPCGVPLTRTTVPLPGIQSTPKLSPGRSFLREEKMSAMRIVPGIDLLKSSFEALSCMPRVKRRPSSLASISRSITTCMRLGPGVASTCSGRAGLRGEVQPGGIDLEDQLVADAGAVELQVAAGHLGGERVLDACELDRLSDRLRAGQRRDEESTGDGGAASVEKGLHGGKSAMRLAGRPAPAAKLHDMFTARDHRDQTAGSSDRGAWPWRRSLRLA